MRTWSNSSMFAACRASFAHVARLLMYSARAPPTLHDVGRPCLGAGLTFCLAVASDEESRCAARWMRNSDDSDDVSATAKRATPAATLNENASKRAAPAKSTAGATESKEATMTALLQRMAAAKAAATRFRLACKVYFKQLVNGTPGFDVNVPKALSEYTTHPVVNDRAPRGMYPG